MKLYKIIFFLFLAQSATHTTYTMYNDAVNLEIVNLSAILIAAVDQHEQYHDILPHPAPNARQRFKLEPNYHRSFKILHPGTLSHLGTIYTIMCKKDAQKTIVNICVREPKMQYGKWDVENIGILEKQVHQNQSVQIILEKIGSISFAEASHI